MAAFLDLKFLWLVDMPQSHIIKVPKKAGIHRVHRAHVPVIIFRTVHNGVGGKKMADQDIADRRVKGGMSQHALQGFLAVFDVLIRISLPDLNRPHKGQQVKNDRSVFIPECHRLTAVVKKIGGVNVCFDQKPGQVGYADLAVVIAADHQDGDP